MIPIFIPFALETRRVPLVGTDYLHPFADDRGHLRAEDVGRHPRCIGARNAHPAGDLDLLNGAECGELGDRIVLRRH